MNVTDSVAKQIGGYVEILIKNAPEIQIYENDNIDAYQWIDSRFDETIDIWTNRENDAKNIEELERILKLHFETYSTKICAAFCGCGKSYLSNNFPDDYLEVECWNYRQGDFPKNYINSVINSIGKTKYLFISTDPIILNELNKMGIKIRLYYPENSLRNEYLDRFIDRKSPFDFIGVVMVNWDKWINQLKELNYCEHIVLKSGEYLQDTILTIP